MEKRRLRFFVHKKGIFLKIGKNKRCIRRRCLWGVKGC